MESRPLTVTNRVSSSPLPDRKRRDQKPRVLLSCFDVIALALVRIVETEIMALPVTTFKRTRVLPLSLENTRHRITRKLEINPSHAQIRSSGNPVHLLSGLSQNVSIDELIASLPSRTVADRLVASCLESSEPSLMIIHVPTFQSQCFQFWQSPATVSPAWLALLYGVLACGVWIEHFLDPIMAYSEIPQTFYVLREKSAVALSKSDLTVPGRFKVEAALIYLGVEYLQSNELKTGVSILLGVVSRLAIMMGYHQSAHLCHPPLLAFEAEMRCRAWLLLSVIDNVVASQTGLPRVIYQGLTNSARPRNLLDDDFNSTMSVLPSSQSTTETLSHVVYMLAIDDLYSVANEIADLAAKGPISPDSTARLGQQLDALKNGLPCSLRMRSSIAPTMEYDKLIMQRTLEIVYQRSRCILHRQYLISSESNPSFDAFRGACVDAARCVLEQQCLLFQEALHGPRNRKRVWFGASRSVSDCLTAAMVICLEVINRTNVLSQPSLTCDASTELIHILHRTYFNLKQTPKPPVEITKAAEILATMLGRMGHPLTWNSDSDETRPAADPSNPKTSDSQGQETTPPSGLLSSPWLVFDDLVHGDSPFEMFDWAYWDREMRQLNGAFYDII
ncbi:hypothetical protein BO86DRAFT_396611 [Aspergillus japonicus CBS 114.51]|uniref:Transcription factor domain-containing protein n=1 Tax=Aspergillus japonicus CBS 114.51 TaxID=1448312 RepID=A0A8T8XA62_ASPJA|nr:hypothetical protein BO86DRAFT_396611 [Aspergillus japonicus CBS 114.51]RAH84978.1 hypothetical protein BO86DRAFT_396611 [Aspergillus japonicus CBS 114.51]